MSLNPSMSTPINSIPLKTSKSTNDIEDDSSDPLVQDVLNEFQREINTNTKHFHPSHPPHPPHHQDQHQDQHQEQHIPIFHPPPHQVPIMHPQPNIIQHSPVIINKNNLINMEIAKKAGIITIISFILFYPGLFMKFFQNILPNNILTIFINYEFYIIIIFIFIIIYLLYYSKQL